MMQLSDGSDKARARFFFRGGLQEVVAAKWSIFFYLTKRVLYFYKFNGIRIITLARKL